MFVTVKQPQKDFPIFRGDGPTFMLVSEEERGYAFWNRISYPVLAVVLTTRAKRMSDTMPDFFHEEWKWHEQRNGVKSCVLHEYLLTVNPTNTYKDLKDECPLPTKLGDTQPDGMDCRRVFFACFMTL